MTEKLALKRSRSFAFRGICRYFFYWEFEARAILGNGENSRRGRWKFYANIGNFEIYYFTPLFTGFSENRVFVGIVESISEGFPSSFFDGNSHVIIGLTISCGNTFLWIGQGHFCVLSVNWYPVMRILLQFEIIWNFTRELYDKDDKTQPMDSRCFLLVYFGFLSRVYTALSSSEVITGQWQISGGKNVGNFDRRTFLTFFQGEINFVTVDESRERKILGFALFNI